MPPEYCSNQSDCWDPEAAEASRLTPSAEPQGSREGPDEEGPKGASRPRGRRGICRGFLLWTTRRPVLSAALFMLAELVLGIALWPGMELKEELDPGFEVNLEANEGLAIFREALRHRRPWQPRRLSLPSDGYVNLSLQVVYRTHGGEDMVTVGRLGEVRHFEHRLRGLAGWKRFCGMVSWGHRNLCDPGVSVANFAWATNQDLENAYHRRSTMHFTLDGASPTALPMAAVRDFVKQEGSGAAILPQGADRGTLRSVFHFTIACCSGLMTEEQLRSNYATFVREELYPTLQHHGISLQVLGKGDVLDSPEILFPPVPEDNQGGGDVPASDSAGGTTRSASSSGLTWSPGGGLAQGICALLLTSLCIALCTRRLWLSAFAGALALVASLLAFAVSARLSGSQQLHGSTVLALLLASGAAADCVLVLVNFWLTGAPSTRGGDVCKVGRRYQVLKTLVVSQDSDPMSRVLGEVRRGTLLLAEEVAPECARVRVEAEAFEQDEAPLRGWIHCTDQSGNPTLEQLCSPEEEEQEEEALARLGALYRRAGPTSLALLAMAIASSLANLASPLRPLRDMGFLLAFVLAAVGGGFLAALPAVLVGRTEAAQVIAGTLNAELRDADQAPGEEAESYGKPTGAEAAARAGPWRLVQRRLLPFPRPVLATCAFLTACFILITALVADVEAPEPVTSSGPAPVVAQDQALNASAPSVEVKPEDPAAAFAALGNDLTARRDATVCNVGRHMQQDAGTTCAMYMCDTLEPDFFGSHSATGSSTCECLPMFNVQCRQADSMSPPAVSASVRFVGRKSIPASFWSSAEWQQHVRRLLSNANFGLGLDGVPVTLGGNAEVVDLGAVVQENWETGSDLHVAGISMAPPSGFELPQQQGMLCDVSEVCYCGAMVCRFHEDPVAMQVPGNRVRLEVPPPQPPGRRLLQPQPQAGRGLAEDFRRRGRVSVVWGIAIGAGIPLLGALPQDAWEYDRLFHLQAPWAQRHLLRACVETQAAGLRVVDQRCWIQDFRAWLQEQNQTFPLRAAWFKPLFMDFIQDPTKQEHLWMDAAHDVKAMYAEFTVAIPNDWTAEAGREYQKLWDRHMAQLNSVAPAHSTDAWHASDLWGLAEAESAVRRGTGVTLGVCVGCGFLISLLLTWDLRLAAMAVAVAAGAASCPAFFLIAICGLAFGPVEALGLAVCTCHSIVYSLRILRAYQEELTSGEEGSGSTAASRAEAVDAALMSWAGTILGSAGASFCSGLLLLVCSLNIAMPLGGFVLAGTVSALFFSLVVLPEALVLAGPSGGGPDRCRCLAWAGSCGESRELSKE